MMTPEQQHNEDMAVLTTMARYGGSFVKALAEAGFRADSINLARIKAAWPDYWQQYLEMSGTRNRNPHNPQG